MWLRTARVVIAPESYAALWRGDGYSACGPVVGGSESIRIDAIFATGETARACKIGISSMAKDGDA